MNGDPLDVRAGQRWRLPGGDELLVNALDGDQVDGTLIQGGTFAVWVKNRQALIGATLIAPLYRVKIHGPKDERAWRVIEQAGRIVHGATEAAWSRYDVEVAAPDGQAALKLLREACSLDPRFDLDSIELFPETPGGET